jgi:hypothetical protein
VGLKLRNEEFSCSADEPRRPTPYLHPLERPEILYGPSRNPIDRVLCLGSFEEPYVYRDFKARGPGGSKGVSDLPSRNKRFVEPVSTQA